MTKAPPEIGKGELPIILFADQAKFSVWLARQAPDSKGLWVRLAKAGAPLPSLTKQQAIDAALCHGWIDGQLDKYDALYWLIRFMPRKPRSKWSQVNCRRAEQLIAEQQMQPAGLAEIASAKADDRWDAAYAPASSAIIPPDLKAALDDDPAAAKFFTTLTGANRYAVLYRITTVKRADTRARKVAEYVAMLARAETIHG
jgi:uncharacterized protein YdeI (YjbR/CyaY-like superfamily)